MSAHKILLEQLERVAEALGDDLGKVVFVGGCVGAVYTLPPLFEVRPTDDIDCVIKVTQIERYAFDERLRHAGFREAADEKVICRWRLPFDGAAGDMKAIFVDIMPTDINVFGFTNRWYGEAFSAAENYQLPSGKRLRVISPLYFVATKLEAFRNRGSPTPEDTDLEDIVATLIAFEDVHKVVEAASTPVGQYIREELVAWRDYLFDLVPELVPGDPHSQASGIKLVAWLRTL